ncbi:MAG: hypothetical protein ACI37O_02435 [Candidatus Avelusimicrobium sp.]|uniref:hypothetical protein n=1 Tax=Candidatus Avelusimicrobium sp. TaxID=3048833 RepID=UPI003F056987
MNGASTVQFYVGKSDTNGTSSDTYVLNENTLNISGKFENSKVKSVALTADGTTYTAKNESADTKGENSTYTRGFHLAGVDIPYPAGDYVQKTGTTSLSDSAALCWVQRCTTEGKVAWVLSLVNGSCPATKTNISCGGSLPDNPSAGLSWQYDGWEAVRSFMCGSGQQEAEQFCRQYPNTAPSGSCSKAGEVKYAICSVNDYCPGHPIDAEVAKYTCK